MLNHINHVMLGNGDHRIFDWKEYYWCLLQMPTELMSFKVNRCGGKMVCFFHFLCVSFNLSFLPPMLC